MSGGGYLLGLRQTQADFEAADFIAEGLSTVRRPGALTFDYLIAFSLGPVAVADVTQGATSWVWRARVDGLNVYVCRENDAKDGWGDEILLFSFEGAPILEIDLAFEQQGRMVICAERETGDGGAKEIWLYWYDPFEADFVFTSFGEGRTPRTLLDDLDDPNNADILVFYIRDSLPGVVFRQQRDRYAEEYTTPVVQGENYFLEDVIKTKDHRIAVIYSILNPSAHTYELGRLESALYPIRPIESMDGSLVPLGDHVLETIVIVAEDLLEELDASLTPLASFLVLPVLVIDPTGAGTSETSAYIDPDELDAALTPLAGTLAEPIITYIAYDKDSIDAALTPQAGNTLLLIVIEYTTYDKDSLDATLVPGSGSTLAIP